MSETKLDKSSYDAVRFACTAFFSREWQLSIIMYLFSGPKHFGEILRYHEGLSKKVLSTNLQKLELKGVVARTTYQAGGVTRVRYSLTVEGKDLQPILEALADWGAKYYPNYKDHLDNTPE